MCSLPRGTAWSKGFQPESLLCQQWQEYPQIKCWRSGRRKMRASRDCSELLGGDGFPCKSLLGHFPIAFRYCRSWESTVRKLLELERQKGSYGMRQEIGQLARYPASLLTHCWVGILKRSDTVCSWDSCQFCANHLTRQMNETGETRQPEFLVTNQRRHWEGKQPGTDGNTPANWHYLFSSIERVRYVKEQKWELLQDN